MSLRDLGPWLLARDEFSSRLNALTIRSVLRQFATLHPQQSERDEPRVEWHQMLLSASLLAECEDGRCQDAALRIAHACIEDGDVPSERRDVAASVLDKLANRVAVALAVRRSNLLPDVYVRLPLPLRIEWTRHTVERSVATATDLLFLNRFQKKFWDAITKYSHVSASAPTATGKSYVLIAWIADFVRRTASVHVVYIVPTRALIYEIENKLKDYFKEHAVGTVNVTSVPSRDALVPGMSNVLVVTQERLQILLANEDELPIGAVIVDEAHKVGDGQRGVLLQQVVERVQYHNPGAKFIFSSPLTTNPELLLADVPLGQMAAPILSQDVTVNQNLMWVEQQKGKPKRWSASLLIGGEPRELGTFSLTATPSPESKRLAFVAHALASATPGNIVYENGPAAAEKTAGHLARLMSAEVTPLGAELRELSDLVRRVIHKKYALAAALDCGVAFHYGNIPLLIKTEIERLFSRNEIKYLVCTSTLVEGVNMSCRNIFLRGPKKGIGRHMSPEDFWNLAGRAGRWGAEFQGNIICVDANIDRLWGPAGTPRVRGAYPIRRTADEVIRHPDDLIEFIRKGTPRDIAARRPDLEYVTSYLVSQQFQLGSLLEASWASRMPAESMRVIADMISSLSSQLRVPEEIVHRNPGISPLALDALLAYFEGSEGDIEALIPAAPASEDAVESYVAIFGRIQKTLGGKLAPVPGRGYMLAILVAEWMRGYPLARLIESRIKYNNKLPNQKSLGAVIRSVLEDVEQIARFEAPRALTAYKDVLSFYLTSTNRVELVESIPDVGLLLEFGASQGTQISLMSIGLSRTAAIELSELLIRDDLSKADVLEWLRGRSWQQYEISPIIVREIEKVLSYEKSAGTD